MLSEFQIEKLIRFFKILDFDGNGVIEKDDFTAIAENLSVLWGFDEDDDEYADILSKYASGWERFNQFVKDNNGIADRGNWVKFASSVIENTDTETFKGYVESFVGGIFANFDVDHDGVISLDEFVDIFVAHRIEIKYSAKAFTKIDENHDDHISRDEFNHAVATFFLSNDPSEPGNLLFGK